MKNTLSRYLLLFCLATIMSMPIYAVDAAKHAKDSSSFSNSSDEKQDPLVGPWTFNLDLAGNIINGVIIFHADKTLIFHDTSELTQAIIPIAPQGDFFTFSAGTWKKRSKHHYEGVSTCVVLARGTECTGVNTPPGCLSFPAVPFARTKNKLKHLKLEKDLVHATVTVVVSFHPANDLGLDEPLINPSTGQPVPEVTGQAVLQKLTFK